jgi:hypothetical protein
VVGNHDSILCHFILSDFCTLYDPKTVTKQCCWSSDRVFQALWYIVDWHGLFQSKESQGKNLSTNTPISIQQWHLLCQEITRFLSTRESTQNLSVKWHDHEHGQHQKYGR